MFENLHFSCVTPAFEDSLCVTKTKFTIFDVLIDDAADSPHVRDERLFKQLLRVPFERGLIETGELNKAQHEYVNVARKIWADAYKEIQTYPRFDEFKDVFEFDITQVLNAMRYGFFVNTRPWAANALESDVYDHHSMLIIVQGTLDLMCSPTFDIHELPRVRKALYFAQKAGKLGNLYNTYPREIAELDVSTAPVIWYMEKKGWTPERVREVLNANGGRIPEIDKKIALMWEASYKKVALFSESIKSIDMRDFLRERRFIHHKYLSKAGTW
jgi:hypothetical protein